MIQVNTGVELNRIEHLLFVFISSVDNRSERLEVACERIMLSQPHMRIPDDALQGLAVFERQPVCFKLLVHIMKVVLAVLCSDSMRANLSRAHLPVHLAVDAVRPWHPVPRFALVDGLVLIRVDDA